MPTTWQEALQSYRYPVALGNFQGAPNFPGWFAFDLGEGDRTQTIAFESHFKERAQTSLAPWLEVIFWKLYSQPGRRNQTTCRVASHFLDQSVSPRSLWQGCMSYIKTPTKETFKSFQKLFGFRSQAIAVAATFPAFLNPVSYPMVDTRIAKWVGACMDEHNEVDNAGPQLIRPPFLNAKNRTVLTLSDFEFMQCWIKWCAHIAYKLTNRTSFSWRARDVDMAVFFAWGERGNRHPMFHLNPLSGI